MKPDTVVRWHREGFRRYWRSISVPGPGRPRISEETRDLIVRMATENGWRARRIQGERFKIGIDVRQLGTAATLGAANDFAGNILAGSSITLGGGTLDGRALALVGAVTISTAEIVNVPPIPEPGTFLLLGFGLLSLAFGRRSTR